MSINSTWGIPRPRGIPPGPGEHLKGPWGAPGPLRSRCAQGVTCSRPWLTRGAPCFNPFLVNFGYLQGPEEGARSVNQFNVGYSEAPGHPPGTREHLNGPWGAPGPLRSRCAQGVPCSRPWLTRGTPCFNPLLVNFGYLQGPEEGARSVDQFTPSPSEAEMCPRGSWPWLTRGTPCFNPFW